MGKKLVYSIPTLNCLQGDPLGMDCHTGSSAAGSGTASFQCVATGGDVTGGNGCGSGSADSQWVVSCNPGASNSTALNCDTGTGQGVAPSGNRPGCTNGGSNPV